MTSVTETIDFPGSSNLESATYDPDAEVLTITFRSGKTYEYLNVPPSTYRSLTLAGSAGEFFSRNVRQRYAAQEV